MILQGDLQQQCTGCLGGVVEHVTCFLCLLLGCCCCVWLAIQCSQYGKESLDQSLLPWELIVLLVYPTPLDLHVVFSPWDTSAFLHRLYTRFHNMNPSFFHPSVLSSRDFHVLKKNSESRTWFCACHWGNKFMNSAAPLLTNVTDCHIYYTGYCSILVALILDLLQMLYFSLHPFANGSKSYIFLLTLCPETNLACFLVANRFWLNPPRWFQVLQYFSSSFLDQPEQVFKGSANLKMLSGSLCLSLLFWAIHPTICLLLILWGFRLK